MSARRSGKKIIEDYSEVRDPDDIEMEAEEQEILDATSRHSISADPATPLMEGDLGQGPYIYSKSQLNQYQDTSLL